MAVITSSTSGDNGKGTISWTGLATTTLSFKMGTMGEGKGAIAFDSFEFEAGQVTTKPEPTEEAKPTFSCEPKKTCGKMASCEEAKYHLEQCGNKRLDRDKDGIPCESLCVKK